MSVGVMSFEEHLARRGMKRGSAPACELRPGDFLLVKNGSRRILGVTPTRSGAIDVHYPKLPPPPHKRESGWRPGVITETYEADEEVGILVSAT